MSKNYPTISLCMIMKDEEAFIAQAIESVKSIICESIVVDTGSKDRSVEIAQALGAKIYSYPWDNDFSAPRNLSLEKAKGDWVLVLDADEAIAEQDLKELQELTLLPNTCWEFLQRHYSNDHRLSDFRPCPKEYPDWERNYAGFFISNLCRLFPNHQSIRYEGRIHELVEHSIKRLKQYRTLRTRIPIHHYGHTPEVRAQKDKSKLYTPLGQTKAVETPEAWKNHFEIAIEHNCAGRYNDCIEAFRKAAALNPQYEPTWTNLGYALCELGRYPEAIEALNHALALNNLNSEAHCNIGVVYMRTCRWPFALAHLNKAIEIKPDYVNAYCNLGQTLIQIDKIPEARQALEHALKLHPHNASAKADLGMIHLEQGNPHQAKSLLEAALQANPNLSRAYYYLGQTCKHLNDTSAALKALSKFCDLEEAQHQGALPKDLAQMIGKLRQECGGSA